MKKKILAILTLTLFLSSSVISFASDSNQEKKPIVGLSYEMPSIYEDSNSIEPHSVSMPSKSNVYLNDTAQYVYGSAQISTLYTNKCFKGIVGLHYNMNNYHSTNLTQELRRYALIGNVSVKKTSIIRGGAASIYTGLSKDHYYFVGYSAPSDFSGYLTGKTN